MLETIIQLAITPLILLFASKSIKGVHIRDGRSAVFVTIVIFIVGFLAGWLLTFLLNVLTLGLFWITGLGVVTRILANAIIIEVIDQYREDFDTEGFLPSLWLAIWLAISWGLVEYLI